MRSAALGHESAAAAAADNQGISKRFACACQCPPDDDDTFRLKKHNRLPIPHGGVFSSFLDVSYGRRAHSIVLFYFYNNRIYII